jgi:hypothetical protein
LKFLPALGLEFGRILRILLYSFRDEKVQLFVWKNENVLLKPHMREELNQNQWIKSQRSGQPLGSAAL